MNDKEEPPSDQRTTKGPKPPRPPSPPNLIDIINTIADRVEPVLKIVTTIAERYLKAQQSRADHNTKMAWVAVAVVTLVVSVSGFLTYVGKVDGSTFTFLLGLIVGYILTFIRDSISPPEGE